MGSSKRYDRAYFDHWYRRRRIGSAADLKRSVSLAIAITEQVMARPLRSVLDLGAGEGRWSPVISAMRPRARYAGVDSSAWVVRHWGRRRNLRLGDIDALDSLGLDGPFDLVVVSDVLHYLPTSTVRRALVQIVPLIGAVAYLPTFTSEDSIEGDCAGFQRRSGATYRRLFAGAGLVPVGLSAWTIRARARELTALERVPTRL